MKPMSSSGELREFLISRRARLSPAEVGLRPGTGRRVRGLRREELAILAGVSADYYARLEQGRARNVSDSVLTAVADALRLDDVERRHLAELVRPARTTTNGDDGAIRALDSTPAMLYGPRLEVLAVNRMGVLLFDDFDAMPMAERNMIRWMFLNPKARQVYPDWAEIAAQFVAVLRLAAGRDGVSQRSEEFAACWADHRVFQHTHGPKRYRHETVGMMTLNYETLIPPTDPNLRVIVYTTDVGSPSAEKLAALSELR